MNIVGLIFSKSDLYLLGIAGSLAVILIGTITYRANAAIIRKREQKSELINTLLAPFNDAIVNIEHGEHNCIMIMNTLYKKQRESFSRAKAIARKGARARLEAAWEDYDRFHQENGKGSVTLQFAAFPPDLDGNMKSILRRHMDNIIKAIETV